jgi:hypothetical protein
MAIRPYGKSRASMVKVAACATFTLPNRTPGTSWPQSWATLNASNKGFLYIYFNIFLVLCYKQPRARSPFGFVDDPFSFSSILTFGTSTVLSTEP